MARGRTADEEQGGNSEQAVPPEAHSLSHPTTLLLRRV